MRLLLISLAIFLALAVKAQERPVHDLSQKIAKTEDKGDSISHKIDSVKRTLLKKSNLLSTKLSLPDSLNPTKKIREKSNALNSKIKSMTSVDSLFLFNSEMKKVDSLKLAYQTKVTEIKNKAGRKQKQIKHSMDSLQRRYQMQADAATKKFMAKNKDLLAGHEKEIADKANFNLPAVSSQFPNVGLNAPALGNIPNLSSPNGLTPNSSIPNVNLPNSSIPNATLPNSSLNIPQIKEIQTETKEINNLEKQAGGYEKQLEQIKKDSAANSQKLEKMLEDQAQGRKEVKALRDKELDLEKQKKLQQQYLDKVAQYKNPQKAEAEIKQNLANVANNDLLKNDKAVQSAQGEMAKAKKKYGEFQSMKNLPKRALNPMRDLPFRQRIYPGIFFQTANNKFFSLDMAPQVYYKITTRFDVGTGFVYRVNYDFKKSSLVSNNDLYGFKAFANFKIYKTFYFRLEGERISKQQLISTKPDVTISRWTNTLLGGIGKEFLITKKIQGNTLVLYNALEKYDNPYSSKVLFRIGFNLSLKKDQRKEFIRSLGN